MKRCSLRDIGFKIGRFNTGFYNSITDVKGIRVGHVTRIEDNIKIQESDENTFVRTGVTAIVPGYGNIYEKRLVAGGFVHDHV
jgi:L-aminopeptidase/D-esterase-like protein